MVTIAAMRDFIILFIHVIVTVVRLAGPGGLRSVVAESALIRHQLLIHNRGRKRAPNPARHGSPRRWVAHPLDEPGTHPPFRYHSKALPLAASPQPVEETKVPHVVFVPARASPRPEGTEQRTHRCCRGYEAAQSQLGLSSRCPADCVGFRRRD